MREAKMLREIARELLEAAREEERARKTEFERACFCGEDVPLCSRCARREMES